jgi:protein-tyrosine phosphatase
MIIMDSGFYNKVDEITSTTIDHLNFLGNFDIVHYRKYKREWPGQLYIGDWYTSKNYFLLKALNIDMVINVTDDPDVPEFSNRFSNGYFQINVDDQEIHDNLLLEKILEMKMFEKIRNGLCLGNVLIHCHAGVSRSATVILCYLMAIENYSLENGINVLKSSRNCVFNYGKNFVFQKTIEYFTPK